MVPLPQHKQPDKRELKLRKRLIPAMVAVDHKEQS